jgi:hypothetical protein
VTENQLKLVEKVWKFWFYSSLGVLALLCSPSVKFLGFLKIVGYSGIYETSKIKTQQAYYEQRFYLLRYFP